MKVNFRNLTIDVAARRRGIELEVYDDDGTHLGDAVVTETGLLWCKRRRRPENGKRLSWPDLIKFVESVGSKP